MENQKILYYGGLWPTNIGNSFIDLGALYILKKSFPDSEIFQTSRFSRFYAQHRTTHSNKFLGLLLGNHWKALDITEYAKVDYVVVSGNVTHTDFIRIEGPIIKNLIKNGAKFIILGGGCSIYNSVESNAFLQFMRSVDTYAFISRDQYSFDVLKEGAFLSFPGIDCGLFISDAFSPCPINIRDYIVCSFDDQNFEKSLNLAHNKQIFRTRHYSFGIRERLIKKYDETLISDLPYDYLALYANAEAVYSDRVHACVAALSYGSYARLFSKSPRSHLFDEISASEITSKLIKVDADLLNRRKQEEINWISSLFKQSL